MELITSLFALGGGLYVLANRIIDDIRRTNGTRERKIRDYIAGGALTAVGLFTQGAYWGTNSSYTPRGAPARTFSDGRIGLDTDLDGKYDSYMVKDERGNVVEAGKVFGVEMITRRLNSGAVESLERLMFSFDAGPIETRPTTMPSVSETRPTILPSTRPSEIDMIEAESGPTTQPTTKPSK